MLDDGNEFNAEVPETPSPDGSSGNRIFKILGGILGTLIFLTLAALVVYFVWLGPRFAAQREAAQATIEAENELTSQQLTSTVAAALWTPTLSPTPSVTRSRTPTRTPSPTRTQTIPAKTPTLSPTPVVAAAAAFTPTATDDPATLTAMQTQLSQQMTSTAVALTALTPAGTGMPATGFFDEVGLPGLVILTLALVVVIFMARRLRGVRSG